MNKTIGNKIKEARLASGITQKELSKKLGCTEIMISRYELGINQISILKLKKISKFLDKPIAFFFEKENSANSNKNTSSLSKEYKKAFVFDLDDTLVDGRQFCGETIARVITNNYPCVNFDLVCKIHDAIKGMAIEDLYKAILKELNIKADIYKFVQQDYIIQKNNIDKMKIFDGVVEILEFLKSNNKKVYICTNRTKSLMVNVLKSNNILKYFDEIISNVDAGYRKPNPYCLLDLIKRTELSKDDFIYFGDSEIDSEFAKNAGIDHIIFDQYLNDKNLFKKLVNMFLEKQLNGKKNY